MTVTDTTVRTVACRKTKETAMTIATVPKRTWKLKPMTMTILAVRRVRVVTMTVRNVMIQELEHQRRRWHDCKCRSRGNGGRSSNDHIFKDSKKRTAKTSKMSGCPYQAFSVAAMHQDRPMKWKWVSVIETEVVRAYWNRHGGSINDLLRWINTTGEIDKACWR